MITVQLADGTEAKIEAAMFGGGYEDVAALEKVFSFEEITSTIGSISKSMMDILRKAKPDKASVEFGVEIGVDSGALTTFLVKGTGASNLKITLEWEEEKLAAG
jgi:tartrate dehydratase alpha subunit/fumarate hydratase class I-like protein